MGRSAIVVGIDDLGVRAVERVLARAEQWRTRSAQPLAHGRVLGLLFLEPSLRTRVGFAAAAARLGWSSVEVATARSGPASIPESWEDTLRTLAGFVDVVVTRPGRPLDQQTLADLIGPMEVPLLNGGDEGPDAEHPSQALVDLFAIRRSGAIGEMTLAVCGDLRMRAVRSLLRLLARTPPRRLILVTARALLDPAPIPAVLATVTEHRALAELSDVDVLYLAGMPRNCLPEDGRSMLRVTTRILEGLPADAVILSPLPLLDEIDPDARRDPRVRMFEQSSDGVAVRMALLEELLHGSYDD